ncbi:hypothetical protein ITP53_06810, partial [Nonomuraea sp. K274]|nr:hypothetical protein [Nonomuraea cypriaca]
MAEPETQTHQLHLNDTQLDTSVHDAGWLESTFVDHIDEIKNQIDATNPDAVRLAGRYYEEAEPLLNSFANGLKEKAGSLAEHYQGPAAYETQLQLRSLAASARELGRKLGAMGRSLVGYGETLRWAQQNVVESAYRDSRSDRDIDYAAALNPFNSSHRGNDRAADHLRAVNEKILEHYQQLPSEVQQALPMPVMPDMPDFNTGNGGGTYPTMPTGGPGGGAYNGAGLNPGSMPGMPGGQIPGGQIPDGATYPSGQYPDGSGIDGLDNNPYGGANPSGLTDPTLGGNPSIPAAASPSANLPDSPSTNLANYDPSLAHPNTGYTTPTGPSTGLGTGIPGGGAGGAG